MSLPRTGGRGPGGRHREKPALNAGSALSGVAMTRKNPDDIHNYAGRMRRLVRRFAETENGEVAVRFLDKLRLAGKKDGRITYYGDRLQLILHVFNTKFDRPVAPGNATKAHCESVLSEIISRESYSGETKKAYAVALLRLVHYAKTGEIGDRDENLYVQEVSWIKPSRYLDKNRQSVRPQDLLTSDEVVSILQQATDRCDRAMYWVLFEGAFRIGELLNMRVGGVDFRDDHVFVTTHGKTGTKRVALVLSFKPLLEWVSEHPRRGDADAFLWTRSPAGNKVSYHYVRTHLKGYAAKAGITRRIWLYLLRHTQLTLLAKRLSDHTLSAYGNWSPNSNMAKKYVHLSGKDVDDAILEMHGIKSGTPESDVITMKQCPRCDDRCTPDLPRCAKCGYITDPQLAQKSAEMFLDGSRPTHHTFDAVGKTTRAGTTLNRSPVPG